MTLRLHLNENRGGCSPNVARALAALSPLDVATYPDESPAIAAAARWFGVPASWILFGNGLDEGLLLAAQAAARSAAGPWNAVIVEPAFEMYAVATVSQGGHVVRVLPDASLAFDADRVLAAATPDTRLVFLCDPNNPVGTGIPPADIAHIADALPDALVLVDEAYADFSGRTVIGPALSDRPNIVAGRTFSKGHGLAGLRIGCLVAAEATIARIASLAMPFRVNAAAIAALVAALDDRDFLEQAVADARASREAIAAACRRLGFDTWPSETNFVLTRVGAGAADCVRFFGERGVLIRDRSSAPGCRGCVRITAGPPDTAARVISLLEEWHAQATR
jgi:histidinol-phosphate aminotransferase